MEEQKINKTKIVGVVIVILIVIIIGLFIKRNKKLEVLDKTKDIEISTATSSVPNGYKIEQVSVSDSVKKPIPKLDRAIVFSDTKLSQEVKETILFKITSLIETIKKEPKNFDAWISLGQYQKMTGDYEGAILSWDYANSLSPTSYIPLANLADLYGYFLKDKIKSESYYKQAISKDNNQSYLYTQLSAVYRDLFLDNKKALEIVEQGLSKIPNDANLLQIKSSFK